MAPLVEDAINRLLAHRVPYLEEFVRARGGE